MRPADGEFGYSKERQLWEDVPAADRHRGRHTGHPRNLKPRPGRPMRKLRPAEDTGLAEAPWETIRGLTLARPSGGDMSWAGEPWNSRLVLLRPGRCEWCGKRSCDDAHHRIPRGEGGLDVTSNLAALCRRCHDWCEEHRVAAQKRGFILPSRSHFRDRALLLWDGAIVKLGDEGDYSFSAFPPGHGR